MPPNAADQFQKAVRLQARNEKLEAARSYVLALQLQPRFFEAAFNLAVLLQGMGQADEAIACYRQALEVKPHYAPAWGHLGVALRDTGQNREAMDCFRQALRLKPDAADVVNNLGNLLRAENELTEAVACFRTAARLSPASAGIQANLGNALRDLGCLDEAVEALHLAIRLQPDYADAHWDLAFTWLLQGDFLRGFEEHEWRWRRTDFPPRQLATPLWHGENPTGRTLLVHAEQGAGDAIQFVRFASLLADQGARVILECPGALVALFQSVKGVQQVIAKGDPLPAFDWHVPIMSLPHRLGVTLNSLPSAVPYLQPPPDRQLPLPRRDVGCKGALRVGLVWRGNPQHKNDAHRSMPLASLERLFSLSNVEFFNLQLQSLAATVRETAPHQALIELQPLIHDFSDTAVLMRQLDLIIAVDTSVAHLAGALALPVWLLLPFAPDWRWLLKREDCPWYPTMRIIRQPRPGDWTSVVTEIDNGLRSLASTVLSREKLSPKATPAGTQNKA